MSERRSAVVLLVGSVALSACFSLRPASAPGAEVERTRAECAAIDRSFGRFSTVAAIAGGVALASGIGGALTDDEPGPELAFGISALVSGVTAGVSGFLSGRRAREYVAGCTINVGGR